MRGLHVAVGFYLLWAYRSPLLVGAWGEALPVFVGLAAIAWDAWRGRGRG